MTTTCKPLKLLNKLPALIGHAGGGNVLIGVLGSLEFNLKGSPFPGWSTAESRHTVAETLLGTLRKMRRRRWVFAAEMPELSQEERLLLMERGQLTGAMAARQDGVHVLINDEQDTECFINDEEHCLVQTFFPGEGALAQAHEEMSRLLADFVKKLPIAHDAIFGYLSCDPAKGGEALFFSALLYLPGLRLTRHMSRVQEALDELGLFLSPIFPAQKKDEGDLYLLHSPAAMAGKLEMALSTMRLALDNLVRQELYARSRLLEAPKTATRVREGIIGACKLLLQAEKLKYRELLSALSMLRLGMYYGFVRAEAAPAEVAEALSRAFVENAPVHMLYARHLTKPRDRRRARALYARELMERTLRVSTAFPL